MTEWYSRWDGNIISRTEERAFNHDNETGHHPIFPSPSITAPSPLNPPAPQNPSPPPRHQRCFPAPLPASSFQHFSFQHFSFYPPSNSFIPSLKAAGTIAINRWKSHPIGGGIRPEAWGVVVDHSPPAPVQNFDRCVTETHVSWLMDTGMFREKANPGRHARALEAVRRMGYQSRMTSPTLDKNSLELTLIGKPLSAGN